MLVDTSLPSYGNKITDWQLGDDRQFIRNGLTGFVSGDFATSAYLTIKRAPTLPDALAIAQVEITSTLSAAGQITNAGTNLLFNVYSANIENAVVAGPQYYYDIRVLTSLNRSWTIETGTIQFAQNVTQTNVAGTPAAIPNAGLPQFRGFTNGNPQSNPNNATIIYNRGDWFMNQFPTLNGPVGWQCIIGGSPGVWVTIIGNLFTGLVPPAPIVWLWGAAPPVAGTYGLGSITWNTNVTSGLGASPNIGWVCIAAGTPGTWKEFGAIGV